MRKVAGGGEEKSQRNNERLKNARWPHKIKWRQHETNWNQLQISDIPYNINTQEKDLFEGNLKVQ